MKDELCGYCHINLERNPDHDVHRCKHDDDYCRCCGKYIAEQGGTWDIDPNYGAFCSIECKEIQHKK